MLLTEAIPADFTTKNVEAEELLLGDKLPEAASVLIEIVDSDPLNSRAFNNLGIVAWKQENWYDAYGLFKHAVELQNDFIDAAANLFDLALKTRKIDEVRDLLIQVADLNPDDEEFEDIALGLKNDGDDIYFCGRCLQQGYFHPDLAHADLLVEAGEYKEATQIYFEVLDTQGDLAEVYNGLGVVSFYENRHEDAFSLFLEAIKLNPVNRDMFMNFFDIAKAINAEDSARQVFDTCKKEYPQLAEIEHLVPQVLE